MHVANSRRATTGREHEGEDVDENADADMDSIACRIESICTEERHCLCMV